MHLNNGLANQCCSKKCPKRDEEMSTSNAGQIEEWIWNGGEKEDSWEAAKTEKEITFLYFVNNKDCTANIRISIFL
jgi:hypothetical protein